MASSDVDQKYLAQLAQLSSQASPLISSSLYQILGLSVMLSRRLVRARRLRRLDTTRDTKSLDLYHHIIWLSREGLAVLQTFVLPYTQEGQHGPELQVMAAKLQASFFHVFCLFHNNPPLSQTSVPSATIPSPPVPLSPRAGNGQTRRDRTPPDPNLRVSGKQPRLRDLIPSYTSEASYLTNPYASAPPGTAASPDYPAQSRRSPAAPPGLAPIRQPTPSSSFIFPAQNFLPATSSYFELATALASRLLPGSHPLRLSVAIEHAAFLWDCVKDGDGSRLMARRAIRECHASKEGLSDADFEDAAECVGVLGRMMKREGLGRSPGRQMSRTTVGSPQSTASPKHTRPDATMRGNGSSREEPAGASMRGGYSRPSPTSTRSTAGRSRGRGSGGSGGSGRDSSSPLQTSPIRSRATRSTPGSGGSSHRQSSSGGTIKPSTVQSRQNTHSPKGSAGSGKSGSDDTKRGSDDSKETTPRGTSALRGSGVSRGGPALRPRAGGVVKTLR